MEFIKVEYEGKEYEGTYKIENCGQNKCLFIVEYMGYIHNDMSLFDCNREDHMKMWAKIELEKLIKKYLNKYKE